MNERREHRWSGAGVAARNGFLGLLVCTVLGCQNETPPATSAVPKTSSSSSAPSTPPPTSRSPASPPVPAPRSDAPQAPIAAARGGDLQLAANDRAADVTPPEVLLTEDHQATCKVGVGQIIPDLALETLDGQATSLAQHMGNRLTVVIFWQRQQPMSVEMLRRLEEDLVARFRAAGVAVVTIDVGDSPEEIRGLIGPLAMEGMTPLRDPTGAALDEVATGLLPRTYLLTADRQVVWLDLEYSRSSRRELTNAILYTLQQSSQHADVGRSVPDRQKQKRHESHESTRTPSPLT